MRSNIERELALWISAFLLSLGIIISLGAIVISFWYVWISFEDKSLASFSILIIGALTVIIKNYLNGGKHVR